MTSKAPNPDNKRTNSLLLKATCVYWLIVKIIAWRMFTASRLFPTAPVFEILDRLPAFLHLILFFVTLILIGLAFFFPGNKFILAGLLVAEICSCLLDQNRWQPWEYQCIFTIFIFLVNRNRQSSIIPLFTFVLASTYFYSGCNKLNDGFLHNIWGQMLLRSFLKLAVARQSWAYYCGYFLPFLELAAGLALLFLKTRKKAASMLILMHLFILVWLGPLGLNYNNIIWPWNIVMIIYLYLIFWRDSKNIIHFKGVVQGWNRLVLISWGILPALGFIGYWDSYLSSGIYSGKSPRMIICIGNPGKSPALKPFFTKSNAPVCNGGATIDLQRWAMAETNLLPDPEIRVYKEIQKKLENQYVAAGLTCYIIVNGQILE